MQVVNWLPRTELPFAAPSRPELLDMPEPEPEVAPMPVVQAEAPVQSAPRPAERPKIEVPRPSLASTRTGAKPVTQFHDEGFLPEAMVNYLARLGWSHGDDEIFSREQFVQWFNLDHLGKSAAQFDEAKLRWVNAQHLKAMSGVALAELVQSQLSAKGIATDHRLPDICELFKDRCDTTVELADSFRRTKCETNGLRNQGSRFS